jgi:hypothetical protein
LTCRRINEAVGVTTECRDVSIDVAHTLFKPIAEFDNRWDFNSIYATNGIALGHQCRQDTSKETGLIFTELQTDQIIGMSGEELVNADEVNTRVGFCRRKCRIT